MPPPALGCAAVVAPRVIDAGVGIGEIFQEKYRVDSIIGHGGMGIVALCTHLALNEKVAIKMLRRDVLDDTDAVERFMREAQAAVKLKSEFVARVTDVGRSITNVPYMVMEYLEGHDLGDLLQERGKMAQPWAVEITLQACEALAEAHSLGIVHRDVKPTNLFVTWRPDGSALIKVLDFGISKSPIGNAMQLTQTQSLLGTPAYMSPEQMRSARMVDARTDIWSLGTVLYEMLEGRRPFEAESFSEMCVKVAVDPPRPMTNTPAHLQPIVLRCLEKMPEQRYASMAELARDLVPHASDPHQAQVLVERMSRMLRRSAQYDWSPSGRHAVVVDPRTGQRSADSVPVPLSPAAIAEEVAVERSAPAPQAPLPVEPARPEAHTRLSTTLAVPRRRGRRNAIAIVALLSMATAVGVAISLARRPGEPAPIEAKPVGPAPLAPPVARPAPPASIPTPARAEIIPASVEAKPPEAPALRRPIAPVRPKRDPAHDTKVAPGATPGACNPFGDPHGTDSCKK